MSDELKAHSAKAALAFVEDGMKLGIGTGSTAIHFIRQLGDRVRAGLNVVGVPTSEKSAELCLKVGVPLTSLDETPHLDSTIVGADEADAQLRLIKGGGGALLREKIVAAASDRMIVIADDSKIVDMLGAFPLLIEVMSFGLGATVRAVSNVCARFGLHDDVVLRKTTGNEAFATDGQHFILDAPFGRISNVDGLDLALWAIPGVVETGLFIGLAHQAVIAGQSGIKVMEPVDA